MTSHDDNTTHEMHQEPNQHRDKFEAFLAFLSESSNVSESASRAKLRQDQVYERRRKEPAFAKQWQAALYEGYLHLEMEIVRRLREGELQGANNDKYDFANAIRLLLAHRENAARAEAQQRNVSAAQVRASIDRKVEAIRKQVQLEKSKARKSN